MEISDGWDSVAVLVDGRWIERRPRRPEVAAQLRRETRLMPWLAPRLPLAVPVPSVVLENPLVVRHVLVRGRPIAMPGAEHGRAVGAFLHALHGSPPVAAVEHGLPSSAEVIGDRVVEIDRFRTEVVPIVPAVHRDSARAILDAVEAFPADTVVHGDLGPEHVLVEDDAVSGVIDFGDAHLGDAAIDLAWALFGSSPAFAESVAASYGVTPALRARALIWHRLGPWYEVTHGFDIGDDAVVRNGVAGLIDRLDP